MVLLAMGTVMDNVHAFVCQNVARPCSTLYLHNAEATLTLSGNLGYTWDAHMCPIKMSSAERMERSRERVVLLEQRQTSIGRKTGLGARPLHLPTSTQIISIALKKTLTLKRSLPKTTKMTTID